MELRKEFEKKTGYDLDDIEIPYPTDTEGWAIINILKKYVEFLQQNLSKQVTEEGFKKFVEEYVEDKVPPQEFDGILYAKLISSTIFSHYILIPKE